MPLSELDSRIQANRCPVFADMSLEERGEILERLEHQSFAKGDTILKEGNSTQYLWIIVRGECRVSKASGNGERELAVLESGAVFGEMSFFHPAPHSASVIAQTPVDIMRLSRDDYDELKNAGSTGATRIALNIVKVLAERLRKMDEFTGQLVNGSSASDQKKEFWEFRSKLFTEWEF